MTIPEIIARRLHNQRLAGGPFASPVEVVRHFGAMQAQDLSGAKWGVGQRCGATDAQVEAAFNSGAILRTHVCRPTWHFVLPEDIRWLLALTAPRIRTANTYMCRKLGLDAKVLARATGIIAKELEGGKHLDREALMVSLRRSRIGTQDGRSSHILMHAELEGLVCSGPRVGKSSTYALLEERVPKAKAFDRDEALAELARRYFNSRGPATVSDLAMWSGLSITDAKKGAAFVSKEFARAKINGIDNWFPEENGPMKVPSTLVNLLPNYDEYGIGYKDRSAFHSTEQAKLSGSRNNPIFTHTIVVAGRMEGTWQRVLKTGSVSVTVSLFAPASRPVNKSVSAAIGGYARFLGLPLEA